MKRAGWLAALLTLSAAPQARAELASEAPRLRISVVRDDAASGCPDARAIEQAVRTRLGRDPFSSSAELSAEIAFTRDPSGFVAQMRMRAASGALRGERTLRSERSCATLAEGVALAVALYIDPDAALAPPPAPAPVASAPAPVVSPPAVPPASEPPPPPTAAKAPTTPARGALSAGMVGGYGILPGLALGVQLQGELTLAKRVHPFVSGAFLPEQSTEHGTFAFGLATASLGSCVDVAGNSRVALAPCLALAAGELHVVVRTLEPVRPGQRYWMAVNALIRLRVALFASLFIEAGAGAWLPFWHETFRVTGRTRSVFHEWTAAPVGQFALGTTFR